MRTRWAADMCLECGLVYVIMALADHALTRGPGKAGATFGWVALLALLFSTLLSIFREKTPGYPYRLFF
jgi:hypothetical protein